MLSTVNAIGTSAGSDWSQCSTTNTIWGQRASICVPLDNFLFKLGAAVGTLAAASTKLATAQRTARLAKNAFSFSTQPA